MVKALMKQNLIRPSNSPWGSPTLLVPEKTGEQRMVIDYRKLNSVTRKDTYPMPDIQLLLDSLRGAKILSSLDLRSGYYQVAMNPESIERTAFVTLESKYEFLVLSSELCNALSTFVRMMNLVLDGIKHKFALVYLDDILIYSKSYEEHLVHLREVFERLKKARLSIKPSKCIFGN